VRSSRSRISWYSFNYRRTHHGTRRNVRIGAPAPERADLADPNAPSFFTALQEQIGLRLEPTKAPFDVTVVDSAEHPNDD
jgi:uncharacterized protein (TIGR03435 family)